MHYGPHNLVIGDYDWMSEPCTTSMRSNFREDQTHKPRSQNGFGGVREGSRYDLDRREDGAPIRWTGRDIQYAAKKGSPSPLHASLTGQGVKGRLTEARANNELGGIGSALARNLTKIRFTGRRCKP